MRPNDRNRYSISDQNVFKKNHTLWGWTYPYSSYKGVRPSLHGQSQREVSQINTFRIVLMCNKLELIYSSFFSTIGSVLYHASTKNPRLWQLSESAWYKAEHQHKSPSHRDFSRTTLQTPALSDWTSFRKRNTISFWEIAACWDYKYLPLVFELRVLLIWVTLPRGF